MIQKKSTYNPTQPQKIRRFMAYIIDWYLAALLAALPISIYSYRYFGDIQNQDVTKFNYTDMWIATAIALILNIIYFYVVPVFIMKGQTLGKKVCRLKIVSSDGTDVSNKMMLVRQILGIMIVEGSMISASYILYRALSRGMGANDLYVRMGWLVITVISAVFVAFKDGRAIHDYMADTIVVEVKRNGR